MLTKNVSTVKSAGSVFVKIKGTVNPKIKKIKFPLLPVALFIHLDSFGVSEWPSFGDISCREVCILLNMMELNGTRLVLLKAPKEFGKLNSNVSF